MLNRKKIIISFFLISFFFSCKTTEKIGDYKYEVKIHRVNTGDFGGMIEHIKTYYLNNEFQAGCIVKSQLFGHEKPTDTVFSTGFTFVDHITQELKCFEFNYYWYGVDQRGNRRDNFRKFIQQKDGTLKLNEFKTIKMEDDKYWEEFKSNHSSE